MEASERATATRAAVVGGDPFCRSVAHAARSTGATVVEHVHSRRRALGLLERVPVDVALLDVKMVQTACCLSEWTSVVVATAPTDAGDAEAVSLAMQLAVMLNPPLVGEASVL